MLMVHAHGDQPVPVLERAGGAAPPDSEMCSRLTLVLDLDDTLVKTYQVRLASDRAHLAALSKSPLERFTFTLESDNAYVVFKRPGLDDFLRSARNDFDIVIFSAAQEDYLHQVVNALDPEHTLISAVYSRAHCSFASQVGLTKDLRVLNRNLAHVVLVDDNLSNMYLQHSNGIPVRQFDPVKRPADTLLSKALPTLLAHLCSAALFRVKGDVRPVLKEIFAIDEFFNLCQRAVVDSVLESSAVPRREENVGFMQHFVS